MTAKTASSTAAPSIARMSKPAICAGTAIGESAAVTPPIPRMLKMLLPATSPCRRRAAGHGPGYPIAPRRSRGPARPARGFAGAARGRAARAPFGTLLARIVACVSVLRVPDIGLSTTTGLPGEGFRARQVEAARGRPSGTPIRAAPARILLRSPAMTGLRPARRLSRGGRGRTRSAIHVQGSRIAVAIRNAIRAAPPTASLRRARPRGWGGARRGCRDDAVRRAGMVPAALSRLAVRRV